MNSLFVIILLGISTVLGYWSYRASVCYDAGSDKIKEHKNAPWQWKFFEIWNFSINFFLGGLIGYYFILVRWNSISKDGILNIADFVLFFIFAMCLLRWFPYLIKNFTEGITVILKRVLDK